MELGKASSKLNYKSTTFKIVLQTQTEIMVDSRLGMSLLVHFPKGILRKTNFAMAGHYVSIIDTDRSNFQCK